MVQARGKARQRSQAKPQKAGGGEARYPADLPLYVAGAAGVLVAFFFTQGLPLWNDDYSQWLEPSRAGWLSLLGRVLAPVTSEPQAWGFSDRPLELVIFKCLHAVFGDWGPGYFFVKSLGFGALCWVLMRWMRRLGATTAVSAAALGLFAVSVNVVAALVWHSDFGVYSQLLLALALYQATERAQELTPGHQGFARAFAAFFATVYLGSKIKGDARLAPLILGAYLALYDRKRFSRLWPWLAATFAATLPWSTQFFRHLPPFLGGAGYQGWTYAPFSLKRVFDFLAGDALNLHALPLSLVGAVGLIGLVAALAGAVRQASLDELELPGRETGLLWIWLGFSLLALGTVAPQNPTFGLRYGLLPLVPATLLLALAFENSAREFASVPWFRHGLFAVLALQGALHFRQSVQHRVDMGHTFVAIDGVYSAAEARHPDARLLLGPGFLNYGFRPSSAPALLNRQSIGDLSELEHYPAHSTYVVSWSSSLDTRFAVDAYVSGCGHSLFDRIFSCAPHEGAFLLRYLGNVPEIAKADALDKKGDLRGARDVLASYWAQEPGNHGAAFVLGLYDYRLGDFAGMERVYDSFAPYFPGHASVVYNWALAKTGVQKLAEASRYFERAYNLAPGDYGIGFNLADTYYKLGKRSRALATVNELLRSHPADEALNRARQQYAR